MFTVARFHDLYQGSFPYNLLFFGEEYRLLYRGPRYIEVR